MVRKLAGQTLDLSDVLPLYFHRYTILTGYSIQPHGILLSKFKELDPRFFAGAEVCKAEPELVHLSDLIEPPTLRFKGFNAYLRKNFVDIRVDYSERIIPDLWFELETLKENRFGLRGKMLGLIEVVDSSDISQTKWDSILDLAEVLDNRFELWICVLRREIHAAFFTCEFLGP